MTGIKILLVDGTNQVRRKLEGGKRVLREVIGDVRALPPTTIPIWCWEGINAKAPRRTILPGYKSNRTRPADGTYETIREVQNLLTHTRAIQISVREREADDVIAAMATSLSAALGIDEVFILSNDSDFAQLGALPRVRVETSSKIDPQFVRLSKATVGDPGDGVPGIKGFGKGGWEGITDLPGFAARYAHFIDTGEMDNLPEFRPGTLTWLASNHATAVAMWSVVGFLPIDQDALDAGTTTGTDNPPEVASILKRFMQ